MSVWTQEEAVKLCRALEEIAPKFGAHVALTGGLLYKDGRRKDCDILFYRIRQVPSIDVEGLFKAAARIGLNKQRGWGWCYKATFKGKPVDCFFPENDLGDDYETEDTEAVDVVF